MTPVTFASPQLKDLKLEKLVIYLQKTGWQPVSYPNPNLQVFQGAADDSGQAIELVLPRNNHLWDSSILLAKAINLLAVIEERSPQDVLTDIQAEVSEHQTKPKIQSSVRQSEHDLVLWVQAALDECKYSKSGKDKLEESQFRDLVRVADTTQSPEVIKNFLRYQVGRDAKWGRGQDSLAERIIQDIDSKLKQAARKISQGATSEEFKSIWIDLIRRYLGYGVLYLRYLNSLLEATPVSDKLMTEFIAEESGIPDL